MAFAGKICLLGLKIALIMAICVETDIENVCKAVQKSDEYLCELISDPKPYNSHKILPGIGEYIKHFNKLAQCLDIFTNRTLNVCEQVFEEQGAEFMHLLFDRNELINGFQWDEFEIEEYISWRGKTLDAWLQCEKHIYQHPSLNSSEV